MTARKTLAILILIASLAGVLTGCRAPSTQARADEIQTVSEKIAGYQLPEGYTAQFAVDLMDYQLVSLEGPVPGCHIFLVQAPKDADIDVAGLQKQAEELQGEQRSRNGHDVTLVETRTASVRGQEVSMAVGEGINGEGIPYRQVTAMFEGRSGPALLNISAPEDRWDWDLVNSFIASIE